MTGEPAVTAVALGVTLVTVGALGVAIVAPADSHASYTLPDPALRTHDLDHVFSPAGSAEIHVFDALQSRPIVHAEPLNTQNW